MTKKNDLKMENSAKEPRRRSLLKTLWGEKGEDASNQHFLLFPQCFLEIIMYTIYILKGHRVSDQKKKCIFKNIIYQEQNPMLWVCTGIL